METPQERVVIKTSLSEEGLVKLIESLRDEKMQGVMIGKESKGKYYLALKDEKGIKSYGELHIRESELHLGQRISAFVESILDERKINYSI